MIAKGLDFPNVTLVGIISADTSLNLPDFRAAERTFQLVSQVGGRSGRGVEPGEVVVQTFDPDNYAIQCAVNHDYEGFYQQELENRRELHYPPFVSMVNIISRDPDERLAQSRLVDLVSAIKSAPMDRRKGVGIIGPTPAVLARLRGEFRWHLVLRSSDRAALLGLVRRSLDQRSDLKRHLLVDVDPVSML
jgi:primosomal protein N' (replication factor Y)